MHIFDYSFLDEGLLPAEIVNLTATIAAFNAISGMRKESNQSIYTELEKIARVQSVKGSNAIEGIVTTDARIKQIVEQTVLNSVLPVSKAEICDILPDVSPSTVEAVLGKMVKTGSVMKLGQARATKYVNAKYIK
nr:hypothetical protein [uncultured Agathobacter sp.]